MIVAWLFLAVPWVYLQFVIVLFPDHTRLLFFSVLFGIRTPNGPPGVLGIWGEWLFIFRKLGGTGNYLSGAREQAHSFGDLGSPAKKQTGEKLSLRLVSL